MPQNTVFYLIIIMLVYGTVPASVYQSLNRNIFNATRTIQTTHRPTLWIMVRRI